MLGVNGESGNGNVMLGVEWYNREEVLQRDREFYRNGWADRTNQTGGFLNATGYSPGQVTVNTSSLTATSATVLSRPTAHAGGRQRAVRAVRHRPGHRAADAGEIYFQPDGRPFTLSGLSTTPARS